MVLGGGGFIGSLDCELDQYIVFADGELRSQVADWANNDDPRWACLWDCTKDTAVFELVRHLLAPTPQLRLKDLGVTTFMQQPMQYASLSLPYIAPSLRGDQITLYPVPGMPTVLYDPHNPLFTSITGPVYRYASVLLIPLTRLCTITLRCNANCRV